MVESKKDLSLVGPQSLPVDNRDNLLGLAVGLLDLFVAIATGVVR